MERYAEYKDSGIALIPHIPQNWEAKPLKYIANCNTCVLPENTDEETEIVYIDIGSVNYGLGICNTQEFTFANAPSRARRVVKSGDTIISTVRTYLKAIAYISDEYDGNICSTGFAVYTPKAGMNRRFLFYALNADWFVSDVERYSVGISYPAITSTALSSLKTILPPLAEQNCIVAYLDHRTAEIDTLLANLQSQVEMLDRYKRELIAESVTKGLDKSEMMKDSGVDWIGETPNHWETTKIKWMFEIVKRIYGKEDRDVLSITQRGLKIRDIESNDGQLAESYANYQVVNVNDFAMNSMDLLTGWVDCSPFEGVTSPDYRVFRFLPGKEQCHSYYKYLFQMCYKNRIFYRLGQGVSNLGRWRLQADQFLNMLLPQPPVEEQEKIAAYLDKRTAQVENLIADITAQMEKLKQYRQIVIHDAVTGKIKVTEG